MQLLDKRYDYIITGMGCAGLSLAVQLKKSGLAKGKKILMVDRVQKKQNDRTWCFWETAPGPFEEIVFRRWEQAWFHSSGYSSLLELSPYKYKMIRGIDFFNHCLEQLSSSPEFEIITADVQSVANSADGAMVMIDNTPVYGRYLFNSIVFEKPKLKPEDFYLLQHFKGWIIRSPHPFFNKDQATLMDFRTVQSEGSSFIYVMPFSKTEALVEYTLFSKTLLEVEDYEVALKNYIHNILGLQDYEILEKEFGVIPMTNFPFNRHSKNILNIGTAGGRTKASSGYTFRFIQKDTADIINSLQKYGHPFDLHADASRFHWYDSVLLNILSGDELKGEEVFTHLFSKNKVCEILKFLDNETAVSTEMRILSTLPQWPFLKAGLEEGFKKLQRKF